jgi:hypothetical protein
VEPLYLALQIKKTPAGSENQAEARLTALKKNTD